MLSATTILVIGGDGNLATLTVGTGAGFEFSTLAGAVAASQNGDVIQVEAGTYTNDFAQINTDITIEGVGGMGSLVATPAAGLLQEKGILIINNANVTLNNIELSGAAIPDGDGGNGAGIRYQGGNLTLNNCYIHNCQDGILADSDPTGTITINNSEFANNGNSSGPNAGYTHNLYVNDIVTLTISNSYFHDANVGHEIKSRAATTIITGSRIGEGPSGTGSYGIDLPNGGNATITGNVIEKGPNSQNPSMIAFGEEGAYGGSTLTVSGNTLINDLGGSTTAVWNDTGTAATVTNNTTYGLTPSQLVNGPATAGGNTFAAQSGAPPLDTSPPYLPVLPFEFPCFVMGTHILTPNGEVAVETLAVGESVITVETGERVAAPVKWIGWRGVDVAAHATPLLVRPVRVMQNAFADGVPGRDLFLSPDHAVFVDGTLIPVRLLVNGGTIAQDGRKTVRYCHVELEAHGVIMAEGLPCESYLDTGNRSVFAAGGVPAARDDHPDFAADVSAPSWRDGACAPLLTDAAAITPIWERLVARSVLLGVTPPPAALTPDADLRMGIDGTTVRPLSVNQGKHLFVVPGRCHYARILSRWSVPAEMTPPVDDRRRLGVCVRRIVMHGSAGFHDIAVDNPGLRDGWWEAEREANSLWRWTNGDAGLRLPDGTCSVELHVDGGGLLYPQVEHNVPLPV